MIKSRYFLASLFLIAVLVWMVFLSWPSKNLTVSFFNVGQGDSIFIQSPSGYQMLIDGGPDKKVLEKLGKVMPFWDRSIDLVVLSHPHADHLVGLLFVLKRYNVGQILATDATHTSPEFLEWLKIIKEKKIPFEVAHKVSGIDLGSGAKADLLYPKVSFKDKDVNDLNETSIVLRLEYAGVSFLFMGDLEEDGQRRLIETTLRVPELKIENSHILKVPHHGSKTSLDLGFLEEVKPKVAVISVGKNKYGHPAKETLEKLKKVGAQVKRTDKDGTIEAVVEKDGKWRIKTIS